MEQQRIIYILDYLSSQTSEQHQVTLRDIQNYLENYEEIRTPSILTIRRDIERLQTSGNDIRVTAGKHNTAYYYLVRKSFTFNEIRFIVDSVSINQFLSDHQKQNLIKKFEGLCSVNEVRQLISRISLTNQGKHSMDLLENLEKVHQIISENRKINFEYGKYDTRKQIHYYDKSREMIPCKVIYFNERFYLKCVDEITQHTRTYRIDRMKNIKKGDPAGCKPVLPEPEGIVLDMFEPERYEHVKLRIRKFLLDDMMEQFREHISIQEEPERPEYVTVRVKVGISQGFYRWVMKYGADMEILSPESIRENFRKRLRELTALYQE
ncbi:MAG: WYL domain-containing protein [Oscillospiraceae bacterium]|nr:WYL domain-containing protein [Oscillospiraceae bacterium]